MYKNNVIQTYKLTDEAITDIALKVDTNNNESLLLILSDNLGYFHLYDVSKNEKIKKTKIHDSSIIKILASKNKNFLYSLDSSGLFKIFDLSNYQIGNSVKLNKKKETDTINTFEVDSKDKFILYNKNLKIQILTLDSQVVSNVGVHSSPIDFLSFSSDGRFILSSTEKDYFISIWEKPITTNKKKFLNSPSLLLQTNSHTLANRFKKISEGVYQIISFNKESIFSYTIDFKELKSGKTIEPVKPSFQITLSEKNLINLESTDDMLLLYGNMFTTTGIMSKSVKHKKNLKIDSKISSKVKEKTVSLVKVSQSARVLTEVEMSENTKEGSDQENTFTNTEEAKDSVSIYDEKLSLINLIKNSIINNDISSLEWTLDQKDHNVIENTVKRMNKEVLNLFLLKLTDLFQSNLLTKSNFIIWVELVFKYHTKTMLSLPRNTLEGLKKIKSLIEIRTKNLLRLKEIQSKLDNGLKAFKTNKTYEEENTYQPLLVYHESDSEDEKNKTKEEAKKQGIKMIKEIPRKEADDDVAMSDVVEDDIMNEDLDIDEEVSQEEKEEMEVDSEEY